MRRDYAFRLRPSHLAPFLLPRLESSIVTRFAMGRWVQALFRHHAGYFLREISGPFLCSKFTSESFHGDLC
jgi:hypothetical protein